MKMVTRKAAHRGAKAFAVLLSVGVLLLVGARPSAAADSSPQISLNTGKAGPRAMEPLTERAILRDFTFAWQSMTRALASNSTTPLNGPFEGNASTFLTDKIHSQSRTGLTSHYLNQTHKVEAVFYAPEGDILELHDTAEYDLEIHDGGKTIDSEHVTVHYVVLMTPGADRWVVRQLQSVPQF